MKKPPILNIDYNSIDDFHKDRRFFDKKEKTMISYWSDGENIYWLKYLIGPYKESFVVYNDIFAKDDKYCFMQNSKLKNVDYASFEVLNHCFAKDKKQVWCIGGKFEPADISTFEVCDEGYNRNLLNDEFYFDDDTMANGFTKISSGYAKDSKQVYCYDYAGKAVVLKNATSAAFVSNNDGHYAWDHQYVFFKKKQIKNADAATWRLIDLENAFSADAKNVFCVDRQLIGADVETLEIFSYTNNEGSIFKFQKDKNGIFDSYGSRVTMAEIEQKFNV